jgi:hypothetical protein
VIAAAFDRILAAYGSGPSEPEVVRAREEYMERTGRVFEEDEIYEARAVAFLEWYALDRLQGEPPMTPAERFLGELKRGGGEDEQTLGPAVRSLCTSHRGLFEVLQIGTQGVLLDDLSAGGRYLVHERRRLPGVSIGDVFEGRIVAHESEILFLRTFLFHPRQAVAAIHELARAHRREHRPPDELCDKVAALRVRCERYKHVPPVRIYDGSAQTGSASAR